MTVKLNLGCGLDKREGYINIDVREEVKPDIVIDLEKELLKRFENECVDEILAKDFIEHLSWRIVEDFLKDCFRVLKKGGKIIIQCPNLEYIAKQVILNPNFKYGELEGWKAVSFWVYGGQDYPYNFHKCGFTPQTIRKLLEQIGFKVAEIRSDGGSNMIVTAFKPKV